MLFTYVGRSVVRTRLLELPRSTFGPCARRWIEKKFLFFFFYYVYSVRLNYQSSSVPRFVVGCGVIVLIW